MEDKNLTARICAFSRAYHNKNNQTTIFDDTFAKKLLSESEYQTISDNMAKGVRYFNPSFTGTDQEALLWVVNHQLAATPLARSAFSENTLKTSVSSGVVQYLILAAGFDTFAYRQPDWAKKLQIFELDYPLTSEEKLERLKRANTELPSNVHFVKTDFSKMGWENALYSEKAFQREKISFCSMLGIIYYLSKQEFENYIETLNTIIPSGSFIVFDYPAEEYFSTNNKHSNLAKAANEEMKACYSYVEMKELMINHGYSIIKHLTPDEMTQQYFTDYNNANPEHQMLAQKYVNYCLACKP